LSVVAKRNAGQGIKREQRPSLSQGDGPGIRCSATSRTNGKVERVEVREQNRDQQKNGILGSSLPQTVPDSGDTEGRGRRRLTEGLKDGEVSLLRTADEG